MEDLVLDSIVEKLTSIDQRTTEISKLTGETNSSLTDLRQGLTALEQECKQAQLRIQEYSPLNPAPQATLNRQSKLGFEYFPARTLPHLISKTALGIFCIYLTVGLRVVSPAIPTPIPAPLQLSGSDTARNENIKKLNKKFPKNLTTRKAAPKIPIQNSDSLQSGKN